MINYKFSAVDRNSEENEEFIKLLRKYSYHSKYSKQVKDAIDGTNKRWINQIKKCKI